MDQPQDPLTTAFKMIEATNPQAAKTVRLVTAIKALSDAPGDGKAAMALLTQINPKYAPYVQLINSMNGINKQKEAQAETEVEPYVQYNHPDQGE